MVKFSIIIPVYNVEKYLVECIESIINQDFNDIEILLVNDGSTDLSGEICEEYRLKDNRIEVIHKKNSGLSDARNVGIEKASGEYLIFLDSDDYWKEKSLKEVYMQCEKENLEVLAYDYSEFDNIQIEKRKFIKGNNIDSISEEVMTGEEYLKKALSQKKYEWYSWVYVIKREFMIEKNFYFKSGIKYEDIELTYKILLETTRIKAIKRNIVRYRKNRIGAITNDIKLETEINKLNVIKKNIEDIKSRNIDNKLKEMLKDNFINTYYSIFMILENLPTEEEKNKLIKLLKENFKIGKETKSIARKLIYYVSLIVGIRNVCKMLKLRNKIMR